MFAGKSFLWLRKNIFIYKNKLNVISYVNNTEINLLIRKKLILSLFFELVNENFKRNHGLLHLNEVINAIEKENTDVDDHQGKITSKPIADAINL